MAIDETTDRLYGLPLSEFTRARNEAAGELRKAGRREEAERVKALRKPSTNAAAVNSLVREHRGEVEQFLRAAAALRDAQLSGKSDLAAATAQERAALARLTRIGGEAVRQTLLAAAVDDDAARQLLGARLERELEPRGFGTLLSHVRPIAAKPKAVTTAPAEPALPKRKRLDDSATRAKLQKATAALEAAESDERRARRHREVTQRELEKAHAAVDKAHAAVEEARAAVETAQGDLGRLRGP